MWLPNLKRQLSAILMYNLLDVIDASVQLNYKLCWWVPDLATGRVARFRNVSAPYQEILNVQVDNLKRKWKCGCLIHEPWIELTLLF